MKILFVSLGCDKNLVDTEMMLGMLADAGHEITDDEDAAEAVIVNTCSFIHDAKEESINTLLEYGARRVEGKLKVLIACGCLAQRYADEIRAEIPEVDAIVGTMAIDEIVKALDDAAQGLKNEYIKPTDAPLVYGKRRLVSTGGHYAYLKIAEGCDKHCTYCVIPNIRGKYRSVPMEVLVSEAQKLCAEGAKEIILVAQETTLYGVDLYGEKKLPELLRKLSEIPSLYTIRLLYCYPEEITDELIGEIATNAKVCHYIDMPIQSGSDKVLKRMGRKTTTFELNALIEKLREQIPDIALRTSIITGFPGETHKDYINTFNFVRKIRFDRLGVFTYSCEEGTPASKLKKQVPEWKKKFRRNEIMRMQRYVTWDKGVEMIGKTLTVMVEGHMPDENAYVCRTYKDAPSVDGYLFLETQKELMTGDLIKVRVTDAKEYDLMGVPEDEFTE